MPICSMYGIFTNICFQNHPNVDKYTIHGASGMVYKPTNIWGAPFCCDLPTFHPGNLAVARFLLKDVPGCRISRSGRRNLRSMIRMCRRWWWDLHGHGY
jgi:hypothetical protein